MSLCEENFARLSRLVPDLAARPSGVYGSRCSDGVDLYLEIVDQAPFTTILRLTYLFPVQGVTLPDPDARLRVYHDAGQVEVIDLRQTVLPLRADYRAPALAEKWQANVFIGKWLAYCLKQGRAFGQEPVTPPTSASGAPVTLCP
ncbi:DUF1249 domain-containing protein [Thiocapsa bogorovii]|uniref:DUF1249 domain-containing protein n=1 Tax=Thiocapsa bogorovii TaxID=521689 RepID=UPI001E548F19|nr:DUF1249 domain-containing protein [Thiocapsa bogorovii]UHD15329.1 DUF1249 domain-containing protein [Thiocapsa bogorovii]